MKKEVQYARDTSTLLPKVDPLFKIRKIEPNGKSRDKTAAEFGAAMKVFLGKKMDRKNLDYDIFQQCLENVIMATHS